MSGNGTPPAGFAAVAARDLIGRGYAPVPCFPRGKKPSKDGRTDLRGWERLRPTLADVAALFAHPEANVGLLLGKPSADLCDVDLDVPEAIAVGAYILPTDTARTGRPGAPNSHYFFRAPGLTTKKYQRPYRTPEGGRKTETIVEVRGTGTQTVMPPSVHPSGSARRGAGSLASTTRRPRARRARRVSRTPSRC
jgi:putative DNA primase/helicase